MIYEAIQHIPLSNYAHGISEKQVVFRFRVARGDIQDCKLYYADRACRINPVLFSEIDMKIVASDRLFDYFEVTLTSPYTRICYYFKISDGNQTTLYYSDKFTNSHCIERSEYYQLPFNHRDDIADVPEWVKEAVIYNIFPDSFATGKRSISHQGTTNYFEGQISRSKNGGTLQGICGNLDYISDLGINCIYINPIFAAGEYHKYDILDYFTIDPCFGTNEDFRELVKKCHEYGIKIIIDGVFNHCGWYFSAFNDVVEKGADSNYVNWFYGLEFPVIRPDNGEDIPTYDCFAYERKMPKLNTRNPEVLDYFCKVCRYWIEEYDIDGWRLDVASEVDNHFWRTFRETAKAIKPDCFIIGEVWESAPSWLRGDMFDSTMNYDFRRNSRDFFALGNIDAFEFDAEVTAMRMRYNKNMLYGQLNLLDSHDVSRFFSVCNSDIKRFKLAILFQMTFVGIPSVFYGDEQGLLGVLEDEYRQSIAWDTIGSHEIYSFYQQAIELRKKTKSLQTGDYQTVCAQQNTGLYVFERFLDSQRVLVALNSSDYDVALPSISHKTMLMNEGVCDNQLKAWGYAVFINE